MLDLLNYLFFPQRFISHEQGSLWHPGLGEIYLVPDILITLIYYSIPIVWIYFVQQRWKINECRQIEETRHKPQWQREKRVVERPVELEQINDQLKKEIAERQRTEDTLRSLYKVSSARKLSFDQRLQGLLALGRRQFGLEMGALGRVTEQHYEVIAAQVLPHSNFQIHKGDVWNLEQTYCRVTLAAKEPVAFESAGTSHWCQLPAYTLSRLESYIGMPVRVEGQVYGTLSFFSPKVRQHPFTAGDRELLKLMAQWVGAMIEHQQAEEALRESEVRFRTLLANIPGAVYRCAHPPDRQTLFVSDAIHNISGYPASDFSAEGTRTFASIIHPEDRERVTQVINTAVREHQPFTLQYRIVHVDGSLRWVYEKGQGVFEQGELLWLDGVIIDITERKRLAQERDRFFTISVDLLCIIGLDGYLKRVNPAFENTLGYTQEELLAKPFIEFVHPEDQAKSLSEFHKLITTGSSKTFENRYRCKDGSHKWLAWTGALFSQDGLVYGAARDITERKRTESELRALTWREREKAEQLEIALQKLKRTQAQLLHNEKMASLGQMVAGIAHEINNPVSFISGNIEPATDYAQDLLYLLQLYQQSYPQPVPEVQEHLKIIDLDFVKEDFPKLLASMKEGTNRICQIVYSLRNFSRLDEAELKQVDIHEGINNTLLILQHRLKPKPRHPEIQVIKEYGQLPKVECYAGQLNQVFMNLLSNAIDALEEGIENRLGVKEDKSESADHPLTITHDRPPTICIRTEVRQLQATRRNSPEATSYVVCSIADNGSGMSEEIQSRIFDPFFTTKPPGQGTGLGLSISYQIVVDRHRGQLKCHSTPGQGTEFVIELPITPVTTSHSAQSSPTMLS